MSQITPPHRALIDDFAAFSSVVRWSLVTSNRADCSLTIARNKSPARESVSIAARIPVETIKEVRMKRFLMTAVLGALLPVGVFAASEDNPRDYMELHQVEVAFHTAGSTKDLGLMLSLFADDAVLTAGGKTYSGKEQIKTFWQSAGPFQPQNQWIGYTPAFRIRYDVHGDNGHLYFECLWVDKVANKIAVHTNSDDIMVRVKGRWLIKDMTAVVVPDL
jgi:hypothetical protein